MKIVPLNDKLVVERLEASDKTVGGIILGAKGLSREPAGRKP